MRSILLRKDVVSWSLYDWANHAFYTSVLTAILPAYYPSLFADPKAVTLHVFGLAWHTSALALWAYANGLFMLMAAATAPALGAIADSVRGKKLFLGLCIGLGATSTAALATVGPGQYLLCTWLFVLAAYAWNAGSTFYDAFLPDLADGPAQMDAISSGGFAWAYAGGGVTLILCLVAIHYWPGAGVKASFLFVGAWWAAFSLPLMLWVREGRAPGAQPAACPSAVIRPPARLNLRVVARGFAHWVHTLRKIRRLPELAKFLAAFFLYNAGIGTIIAVAAAYAKSELGLSDATIIGCILMVQFVGAPAALGFIWLARRLGSRGSILLGVALYMAVVVYAMQIRSAGEFWVLGFMVALVQGGTQAMSRSLFGSMIPPAMNAEFFGFFSIFNKVGPFIGPMLFGVVRDVTGSSRRAILFLIVFFVLGLLMLLTVRVPRGRDQARQFAAE